MHNTKFNSPVLGEEVKNIYSIYGKNEECFINT